jgi:hypothetical protein
VHGFFCTDGNIRFRWKDYRGGNRHKTMALAVEEFIRRFLTSELGLLDRLGIALDPPALAEASVAVVVPFRCRGRDEGVFKVLKPGTASGTFSAQEIVGHVGSWERLLSRAHMVEGRARRRCYPGRNVSNTSLGLYRPGRAFVEATRAKAFSFRRMSACM